MDVKGDSTQKKNYMGSPPSYRSYVSGMSFRREPTHKNENKIRFLKKIHAIPSSEHVLPL